MLNVFFTARKQETIIISHINLALIGLIVKTINPGCKIWLIAHGIEVWRPLSPVKKALLKRCDKIICVSHFTKQQIISRHQTVPEKCEVVNNVVDPFIKLPVQFSKPQLLLEKYGLKKDVPVIFTLSRLASTEQYKGHDQVIKVMDRLKNQFPGIKYILAGAYDEKEKIRINSLISAEGVSDHVILTGFIPENEIPDYLLLADVFVLPSKKEGFGIVFIEALACGLPVVCGNADGSIDAICNGSLGKAINPDDPGELENAISGYLRPSLTSNSRQALQQACLSHFSEADYIKKLEKLLI